MRGLLINTIVLMSLCSAGCGDGRPTRVPVSGQVLIDDKPLNCGLIRFVPAEGRMSIGDIDSEGRFKMSCYEIGDGVVAGTHQVEVAAFKTINNTTTRWFAPKKYSEVSTSGLEQKIDGPTDSVVIRLTWDGGRPFDIVDGVVREVRGNPEAAVNEEPETRFGRRTGSP